MTRAHAMLPCMMRNALSKQQNQVDLMQAVHQLALVNRMKDHAGGNASAAWRYWIKEETARQSLAAEFAKQHKLDNPDEIESALKIFFIAETYRHKKRTKKS